MKLPTRLDVFDLSLNHPEAIVREIAIDFRLSRTRAMCYTLAHNPIMARNAAVNARSDYALLIKYAPHK